MFKPKVVTANYRIVTPMFIGGANQRPDDGIRPASVKGALRFWWRALNWGHFWSDNNENEERALQALHQEEARLFGSSMKDGKGGQGCFLLSVVQPDKQVLVNNWPPDNPNNGASYMAYGLLKTNDEPHKFALKEGVNFSLKLLFKPNTSIDDINTLKEVLNTWSLFGGLGSRSRRAMGSITIVEMDKEPILFTESTHANNVSELLSRYKKIPLAPFTAFSKETSHRILQTNKDARFLIEQAGADYKAYRGQDGLRGKLKIPFGLPLEGVDTSPNIRRSSPLFFHAHQLEGNNCISSLLYLPSRIFHREDKYKNVSMDRVKDFALRGNQ